MNIESLRNKIYKTFFEKPEPLFIFEDIILPAATVWVGVREWIKFFRMNSLSEGDRVYLSMSPKPTFIYVLLASFWERISLVIDSTELENENSVQEYDCTIGIQTIENRYNVKIDENSGLPFNDTIVKREYRLEKSNGILLFLKTSGSTNNPKLIGLSEENIISVLDSHIPLLGKKNSSMLSILPWHHAFGLIIDLLSGMFESSLIVRDVSNGKDPIKQIEQIKRWNLDSVSGVPLQFDRILSSIEGDSTLQKIRSGVIGGSNITSRLASILDGTNIQVGYGQTEASPGITLGKRGYFKENYLGSPVGCDMSISSENELLFTGKNVYRARLEAESLVWMNESRIQATNDLVEQRQDGLYFLGRKDFSFKLENGTLMIPELIESDLKKKFIELEEIVIQKKESTIQIYYHSGINLDSKIFAYMKKFGSIKIINWEKEFPKDKKGLINRKFFSNLV
ncbi:MAG: AMP-binding protein [Leptospiraceae bacterium]|nr:AMP-binding protein [Leptospiraceae bacterium]